MALRGEAAVVIWGETGSEAPRPALSVRALA